MKWSRTHTLAAGLALILITNTVALVGVAYNRSGEPESTLKLSQRELQRPYEWGFRKENSGISLALQWRVLAEQHGKRYGTWGGYSGSGISPDWLDKTKLAELGFDVSELEDAPRGRRRFGKILPKEVLLVLELNGPAYRIVLEDVKKKLQNEEALLKNNAGKKEFKERVKKTKRELYREENIYSRLFVIDAGLDVASLRAKYPDRDRYAIVYGQIRPYRLERNNQPRLTGYVSGLSISQINVPAQFREIFESSQKREQRSEYGDTVFPFEAIVSFGKRLEPWMTKASAAKN